MATKGKRRGASAHRRQDSTSAWTFLAVGLLAGFFLGMLVPLSRVPPSPSVEVAESPSPAATEAAAPKSSTTRFDFYTLLPEREVIVPVSETSAPSPPQPTNTPARPEQRTRFVLQAGSFRRAEDADRRRAQVLLLGLDARIEGVNANGDRWHRVIVGPFDERGPLDRARATLISENIDTLVLSQKRG